MSDGDRPDMNSLGFLSLRVLHMVDTLDFVRENGDVRADDLRALRGLHRKIDAFLREYDEEDT